MTNNPYRSPETQLEQQQLPGPDPVKYPVDPVWPIIQKIAWCYPLFLVASFYGTWLIAWISLGHMPRPSLDDPKSIGPVVDVFYIGTFFVLSAFPGALLIGVVAELFATSKSWIKRLGWTAILLLIWAATIAFLRMDPFRVGEWLID